MKNLQGLFEHQLKDLYSAEQQLIDALPKMAEKAKDLKLKEAFENHLEETKNQKARLEDICAELDIKPTGEKCKAMEGLIKEANSFMDDAENTEIMNVGLIAEAQRVEHYEISGYGTAVRFAKELGYHSIAEKLQKTLNEEYNTDNKLDKMAEGRLNAKAMA